MANYPPTPSFGLNFGAATAPASATPGSAYNTTTSTPYSQDHTKQAPARSMGSDQIDSYAAFQQNQNIPAFSAAAVAAGIPPLPIYPGWSAPASWRPGTTSSHTPIMSGYGSNGSNGGFGQPAQAQQLPFGYMATASSMSVTPSNEYTKNTLRVQETEEGELSEGDSGNNAQSTSASIRENGPYDNQNDDPYNPDDEYEPAPAIPDEDDDAYSPAASPIPIEDYSDSQVLRERNSSVWQDNGYSRNEPQRPSYDTLIKTPSRVDENRIDTQSSSLVVNKTHAEVLKLAENAVLNLMPAKVSFQDYLDEGVSEDLIKRIFVKLRLPQAPAKVNDAVVAHPQADSYGVKPDALHVVGSNTKPTTIDIESSKPTSDTSGSRKDTLNTSPNAASTALSMASGKASKAEERKDMIARLMAEKANKKSAVPSALTAPTRTSPLADPVAPIQPSPKIDKQQLLRQKMEALTKSREARAAKMALNPEPAPQIALPSGLPSTASNVPPTSSSPANVATPTQLPVRNSLETQAQNFVPTVPSIPGLFLASTASPQQSPNPTSVPADPIQPVPQRKRPVASDFDEPTPSISTFKRPFGHSRHDQRLVIDVSDEDNDEESDMDIDEPSDDSSAPPIVQQSNINMKSIRDQPPLTDVPSRKTISKAATTMGSPSTPQSTTASDRIKMHEQAILEMRKKIEEAEARKKAKQAQSGTHTPRSVGSSSASDKAVDTSIAQTVADSVRIERMIDDVSREVDLEKQELADEQQKALELQRMEAQRRKDVQGNIKSRRLAQLQAEIARHDAAIQRGIEEKRRLAEEMEKLGQEADEMFQADADKLHALEAAENTLACIPTQNSPEQALTASPPPASTTEKQDSFHTDSSVLNAKENSPVTVVNNDVAMSDVPTSNDGANTEIPNFPMPCQQDIIDNTTPDQNLELALQNASAETEDIQISESDKSEHANTEIEESYAPNPEELAPESAASPANGKAVSSNAGTTPVSEEPERRESEDYEPPEATPPAAEVQPWVDTPAFSSLEPTPVAMSAPSASQSRDISPVVINNDDLTVDDISGFEQPDLAPLGESEMTQAVSSVPVNSHDVSRHLFQQHIPSLTQQQIDEHNNPNPHKFFTPYESPLKHFRAYRFHPKFNEDVAGGFRSLTYSHKIQQEKPLCRYELAGGICNDPTCDMQHFRELSIPDDAILVHLGDSSAYSDSDKANFIKGLREVLQDLRVKKLRDFQTIATEIAAFRSKFLNDSSRVLTLNTPAL